VDMENARQMFERRQKLLAQDAIAREEVDEAERRYKSAQAAVRVAESNVDVARQRLDLAREGSRAEEVRMAEETLYSAQQTLEQAKSDQGKRDVAQNDLEAARVAERRAESAVQAAKAGLVQTRMSQDEVASARAAISQARADIEVYQSQLADLVIRAPVSGVVTTRRVNVGETVTSNSVLMNVVAMDVVYFEARVPELEVSLLRPGASARVFVDSKPGRQFTGIVREVIPVADRDSRAFRVRVAVQGGGGELPPGGYARAIVPVGTHGNAVAIAKEAVHTEAGVKFVWLVADSPKGGQVAKRQPVKVGLTDAKYAEVLGGLAPGQRVITSGSPAIIEGTPISVVTR